MWGIAEEGLREGGLRTPRGLREGQKTLALLCKLAESTRSPRSRERLSRPSVLGIAEEGLHEGGLRTPRGLREGQETLALLCKLAESTRMDPHESAG